MNILPQSPRINISREIYDVRVDPIFEDGNFFCCSVRTAKHQS